MINITLKIFDIDIKVTEDPIEFNQLTDFIITEETGVVAGPFIWVSDLTNLPLVVHEVCHIVDWLLEERLDMNVTSLRDTTELRAYITEYIFKEIVDATHI